MDECLHQWAEELDRDGVETGEVYCEGCEATPAEVLAAEGSLEMPCGHVVTDAEGLTGHINWSWMGEGTIRTCDLLTSAIHAKCLTMDLEVSERGRVSLAWDNAD